MSRPLRIALLLLAGLLLAAGARLAWEFRPLPADGLAPAAITPALLVKGEQLARAGNCAGCHSAPGGAPYAGGVPIATPFGTAWGSNLTPSTAHGLGTWTAQDFRHALRHGRSKDGRLLLPVFPYPHYTLMPDEDADALFAWLRTLPAADVPSPAQAIRFPFGTQPAIAAWRALYFEPGPFRPDATRSAEWNRGAYLVNGPGHCAACHATRDALAGPADGPGFAGQRLSDGWHAPSLHDPKEAGVQRWSRADVVALLRDGITSHAVVAGPMAQVVLGSTAHLPAQDLQAMATYLQALPEQAASAPLRGGIRADATQLALGGKLYETHCQDCHGADGRGEPGAWPALAGNRTLSMATPDNAIRLVLLGGYAPATPGNPRPHGMPPYATTLSDADIAAVLTWARQAWGNAAPAVAAHQVDRQRRGL